MATAVTVGKTGNAEIDGLLIGTKWTGPLTYTFPDQASDYGSNYGQGEATATGFAQISAVQQQAVAYIMGLVAGYTNLDISYSTSNSADIRLAQSSKANPTAYAYTPGNNAGGDVWFGTSYNYTNPIPGSYYFTTHIHELGHSLGLKHSQEAGGVANIAVPAGHDAMEYTVMSYRSYVGGSTTSGYTNEAYGYPTTYMMNDILALQTLYGADYTTNATDTVYTWNAATGQMSLNGIGQLTPGANRVFLTTWDGGGNDTYDMSNYATGVSINLNPGSSSITSQVQRAYLGGGNYASGTVYNAYLFNNDARSYIENAIGGAGADTLVGNAIDNRLDGRAGSDVITTGAGNDTIVFRPGYGADRITDFVAGAGSPDKIDLTAFSNVNSLADIISHASQVGDDTVIDLSSYTALIGISAIPGITVTIGGGLNDKITLTNVNLNSLTADDFIFAAAQIVATGAKPTGISLSAAAAAEGVAAGTVVGAFSPIDADSGQTYSYSLLNSAGGLFAISGSNLVVAGALNYEAATSYSVTVRVTDSGNQTYDQTFTIAVTNVAPDRLADVNGASNSVAEGAANGATVGITASANDPNGGATYTLTNDAGGRFAINKATGVVTVAAGTMLDYETASSHTITVEAKDSQGSVSASYTIAVTDVAGVTINGTSAANTLNGTNEGETINGQGGNDTISGNGGNDTLNGGAGSDRMYGGLGNDTYVVDSTGDTVSESPGEGTDTVQSSVTFTLAANVENLTLTGSSAINGTGNGEANVITGNSGNNTLSGLGGDDTLSGGAGNDTLNGGSGSDGMSGGAGNDTYVVDSTGDTVVESANAGTDTVQSSMTFTLGANVENLTLTGSAAIDGTGNTLANVITGNNLNNVLRGLDGNDTLNGGGGDDTLEGGAGNDTLNGGAGVDTVTYVSAAGAVKVSLASTSAQATGGAGSDTLSAVENLTGSKYADTLTGSTGNNVLSGLDGNDTLSGGNGNDTLIGGADNDTLTGGSGADAFVFDLADANKGFDTITDFVSKSDWLQISGSGLGAGSPTLVAVNDIAVAYDSGNNTGYFLFDNSGANSGTIYWDATGGLNDDAIAFARINGTTLLPSDFHIV